MTLLFSNLMQYYAKYVTTTLNMQKHKFKIIVTILIFETFSFPLLQERCTYYRTDRLL